MSPIDLYMDICHLGTLYTCTSWHFVIDNNAKGSMS